MTMATKAGKLKYLAIAAMLFLAGCQTLNFGVKDEPKKPAAEPTLEDTLTPVDPPAAPETPEKPRV